MSVNVVEQIDGAVKVSHVLASVSDKSGLEDIIPALVAINPEIVIYSTGGTYSAIKSILGDAAEGKNLVKVSQYTGQPEMQGGLVKTLDFKIYLGLLSETYNDAHREDLARVEAVPIDMVLVNLYPFAETVARADSTLENARSNIDIGGPCMVRASAKNFLRVASVTSPSDYAGLIDEMKAKAGMLSLATRFNLAKKAFAHTASYDASISSYLNGVDVEEIGKVYDIQG